jgi:hypothetical protein
MCALKEFTTSSNWWAGPVSIWGGGHTQETDPTKQGWKAKKATPRFSEDKCIVGQSGVPGCALVSYEMPWENVIISYFREDPKFVAQHPECEAFEWDQYDYISGWGLKVIADIKHQRENDPVHMLSTARPAEENHRMY